MVLFGLPVRYIFCALCASIFGRVTYLVTYNTSYIHSLDKIGRVCGSSMGAVYINNMNEYDVLCTQFPSNGDTVCAQILPIYSKRKRLVV